MVQQQPDAEAPTVREEIPHDHLFKITGLSSSNLEKLAQEPAADFEDAISATGYGKFNLFLMLATLPAFWSAVSVTSSASYIFTRAQCDMNLSLLDMGTVSAITYGGMISSALIWGFLSDTLGRKKILVFGFLASGFLEIAGSMSQNFAMLLVTRFASGFMFNGPFAVLISYLAELHRTDLRARVILLTSLFYTIANTTLPLLAWGILTQDVDFYVFGNKFVIHSWNLFLLATAAVPLITGISFSFMPESPKFLMSRGRNQEALEVFRKIYMLNSGKTKEDFSITRLVEEKSEQAKGVAALRNGWAQLSPLFKIPHGPWLLVMCLIHIGAMFGANTIRLWYPQLAAMIGSESTTTLCSAIAPSKNPVIVADFDCVPIQTDMLTYLQSSIVGIGSVLTYAIGGIIVNRCGKKMVAGVTAILSAVTIALMPFLGNGPFAVVAMVTVALSLTALNSASLYSINVELFPTSLRVMAMATFLMCGRFGTISGTVAFPALIAYGCYPPFLTIAAVLAVCGMACFTLPNTTLKKLE